MAGYGFKAYNHKNQETVRCIAASGNSDQLGIGDAVVLVGSTTGSAAIGTDAAVPAVARGAATGSLFGYIESIEHASMDPFTPSRMYRPASTACYLSVVVFKPSELYQIQADGAMTLEDVGENGLLATIANCDSNTGLSTMVFSAASVATSQTAYQMTVMGAAPIGSNAITDSTPDLLVRINNIQAQPGFAGV